MIYIIIGRYLKSGNEWVERDTFDNAADAAERCDVLNTFRDTEDVTFRAETVEPSGDKTPARLFMDKKVQADIAAFTAAWNKKYNRTFGQAKMDHEEGYPYGDTDSIRTKDFTLVELFGMHAGEEASDRLINCTECGAVVSYTGKMLEKHRTWHNKLLP